MTEPENCQDCGNPIDECWCEKHHQSLERDRQDREAEKDREFDERCALGYL